ncbi:MAG: hypothetical protein GXN93_00200 [Candidatus Diapherotrites archaeon]|nr:hypothetical protein [Candidatus Diapherotrites archaeon]
MDRKVGLALYKGPKTPEEIADEVGEDVRDVMDSLKKLIKLKIVVKEGYPPKYRLADNIQEALQPEDWESVEGIRIHAIIEAQSYDENALKKALESIVKKLKKESGLHIVKHAIPEIEQTDEGIYSGYVEVKLATEGIEPLLRFLFNYGPSVIEVLGPEKIMIDSADLQRGLLDAAGMIQGYVEYISRLMTKKELEEFNKSLWKSLYK